MTIGSIFSVTVGILRTTFRTLLVLSLLLLGPAYAILAIFNARIAELSARLSSAGSLAQPNSVRVEGLGELVLWTLVVFVLSFISGALASIAFSRVVADRYVHKVPSVRVALSTARDRFLPGIGTSLLYVLALIGLALLAAAIVAGVWIATGAGSEGGLGAFLAIVTGVGFGVAFLVLTIRWALAQVIVALEPVRPRQALVRSWRLTSSAGWRTFGILVCVGLIGAVIGVIVSLVGGRLIVGTLMELSPSGQLFVDAVLSSVAAIFIAPIGSVALAVFYLDLRTSRESWTTGAPVVVDDVSSTPQ